MWWMLCGTVFKHENNTIVCALMGKYLRLYQEHKQSSAMNGVCYTLTHHDSPSVQDAAQLRHVVWLHDTMGIEWEAGEEEEMGQVV